jgi:hypothetical protein
MNDEVEFKIVKKMQDSSSALNIYIVASHSDHPINNRLYPKSDMKKAAASFLLPYKKPVLKFHNSLDGEPIGRVVDSFYVVKERFENVCNRLGIEDKTFPEDATGALIVKAVISDTEAIDKILDGRYSTVSVGFTAEKQTCSICNKEWIPWWEEIDMDADDVCKEHFPGKIYDGKPMYLLTHGIEYDEISFVNVPADSYAKVVNTEEADKKTDLKQSDSIEKEIINEEDSEETEIVDKKENTVLDAVNDDLEVAEKSKEETKMEINKNDFVSREEYEKLLMIAKKDLVKQIMFFKDKDNKQDSEKYKKYYDCDIVTLQVLVDELSEEYELRISEIKNSLDEQKQLLDNIISSREETVDVTPEIVADKKQMPTEVETIEVNSDNTETKEEVKEDEKVDGKEVDNKEETVTELGVKTREEPVSMADSKKQRKKLDVNQILGIRKN